MGERSAGAAEPGAWARPVAETVFAHAEAFALDAAPTLPLRALLANALGGLRELLRRFPQAPPVHLPLLVYGGLHGDDAPAIPLAAATTLFYLGLDVCDDLADGDLPAHWAGYQPSEITLVSLALIATLPQLAIARLDAPAATREAMQATLAGGLLQMIGGQQGDLSGTDAAAITTAQVVAIVAAKSGQEMAICTSLAAQLAGASAEQIERCAALGLALGTAGQLASDCHDVFGSPHSKDLAAGTRTLPIVLGLNRLQGPARAALLALLERARHEEAARQQARQQLHEAGVLQRCALTIEVHRQRALRLLDELDAREPARGRLRTMLESIAWPRPG